MSIYNDADPYASFPPDIRQTLTRTRQRQQQDAYIDAMTADLPPAIRRYIDYRLDQAFSRMCELLVDQIGNVVETAVNRAIEGKFAEIERRLFEHDKAVAALRSASPEPRELKGNKQHNLPPLAEITALRVQLFDNRALNARPKTEGGQHARFSNFRIKAEARCTDGVVRVVEYPANMPRGKFFSRQFKKQLNHLKLDPSIHIAGCKFDSEGHRNQTFQITTDGHLTAYVYGDELTFGQGRQRPEGAKDNSYVWLWTWNRNEQLQADWDREIGDC